MADEPRDEGAGGALDKAKDTARRWGGWLRDRVGQAAERAKDNPFVAEKMEQVEKIRHERAEDARKRELDEVYWDAEKRLSELLGTFKERLADLDRAKQALDDNVAVLRNRAVSESDPEMAEYKAELRGISERKADLNKLSDKLADERERLNRRRAAAQARLTAGEPLAALQAKGREQAAEIEQRVDQLLAGEGHA
jgi:chromosome segregation ATPase